MADQKFSHLQQERLQYAPPLPKVLAGAYKARNGDVLKPATDADALQKLFPQTFGKPLVHIEAADVASPKNPLKVGCVLSGGQAPGGHNVISGLFDSVKKHHPDSILYGFLDGPKGLMTGKYKIIDHALMAQYRNTGGFDLLGSGRDKIEKPEEFAAAKEHAEKLGLDGVIIIGGDDSNTNAAVLAEYFASQNMATRVVGCPKTIDGDLKVPKFIPISFGFDTACRTYATLVGNVCLDALSSGKYYHFIRLMGRAASNITLEVALQTHPNITLLGEEVAARKQNLSSITEEIVSVILQRAAAGKNYGVILVPEGLIEFVPEMNALLKEINEILAHGAEATVEAVAQALSPNSAALFAYLPASIKRQLLAERDPHGNVQVSLIETEGLLAELVQHELAHLAKQGRYPGAFTPQFHFYGYEGRCGLPCEFDTVYCYALGYNAGALIASGATGVISSVSNLDAPVEQWTAGGTPLTILMNLERRHGKDKPVIKKALVELNSLPFKTFASHRAEWAVGDCYRNPGPIQFGLGAAATDKIPLAFTLHYELQEQREGHVAGILSPSAGTENARSGYRALMEGLLGEDNKLTAKDVSRLLLYRLHHTLDDTDHYAVLGSLGIDRSKWAQIEAGSRT